MNIFIENIDKVFQTNEILFLTISVEVENEPRPSTNHKYIEVSIDQINDQVKSVQ